ncbi:hypothetical protein [Salipaludibacillus agaradhaerens]|uniref:hypothetical protein n=1 Tax=Salipaludibacillus agaradhaerens TaxID=76935 RepID=UPI0009961291|nr:hypothetical protein [Salipaludibacillus agaradhaerens]
MAEFKAIAQLNGPEKIKISDDQLKEILSTYQAIQDEMESMLNDFFTPLEIMESEGAFTGQSAEVFTTYCTLVRSYLETRYLLSFEEIKLVVEQYQSRLNDIDQLNI